MGPQPQEMIGRTGSKETAPFAGSAKSRLKWTRQLHERFVDAVSYLGGADKATPKSVLRLMDVPGLTLYHLKSHLQKYRLAKSREPEANSYSRKEVTDCCVKHNFRMGGNTSAQIDIQPQNQENMVQLPQMEMEVQRKLQEQIEVQKHLQLRIEAQGKYLLSVLRKAQETLAVYDMSSIGRADDRAELSAAMDAECMSTSISQLQGTDCSMDSCLTSSESATTTAAKRKDDSSSLQNCSEDSEESRSRCSRSIYVRDTSCVEELDLNR